MVREIVFDTETTGFDPENGDKLVEIGAVELINHIPTGVTYHQYINPQREVPEDAFKVHGLSYDYLKQFPTFDKIVDEWKKIKLTITMASFSTIDVDGFCNDMEKLYEESKNLAKSETLSNNLLNTDAKEPRPPRPNYPPLL